MTGGFPATNWFEQEVLKSLTDRSKYGQMILIELSNILPEKVSSGRLYPVLQKLEKNGFIRKSESEKGRYYYSLTGKGKQEIDQVAQWSLRAVIEELTRELIADLSARLKHHISSDIETARALDSPVRRVASVRVPPAKIFRRKRFGLVDEYLGSQEGIDTYLLWIDTGEGSTAIPALHPDDFRSPSLIDMTAEYEDLPLKANYADIVILGDSCQHAPDRDAHMREVMRIMKPGGKLYFLIVAKYDSYILESLFDMFSAAQDDQLRPAKGMEESEVRSFLEAHLDHVKIERIKEFFICTGTKRGAA